MAADDAAIRSETFALDALIRETIARDRHGNRTSADALLVLGNWHQAFPAVVVQDPVLEPVDKLIWMVICQSARGTGTKAVFPSYADIARLANVASTATVSRAIAILRATRWLSLCARSRHANGRFGGNVYALHDEPLPLTDALHLDPEYMAFLKDAATHHHPRVRRVVAAVLTSLDEDIRAGEDVLAPVNVIARRLEAIRAIHQGGERRYFSFNATVLASLSNAGARRDRIQNSKAVAADPQNLKAVRRSRSKYIKTTTTPDPAREAATLDALIFPTRLKDNQRALAARYLAAIPAAHRQAVLDELAGRLAAERQGAKPVYDELRYLYRLCAQVHRGDFVPNLGLKVQAERERGQQQAECRREEVTLRERAPPARATRPRGESALAEIRAQLGIPVSRDHGTG